MVNYTAHAIFPRRTLTREAKHNVCAKVSYFLELCAYTFCDLVISGLFLVEPLSVHFQRFQIENVNLTFFTTPTMVSTTLKLGHNLTKETDPPY